MTTRFTIDPAAVHECDIHGSHLGARCPRCGGHSSPASPSSVPQAAPEPQDAAPLPEPSKRARKPPAPANKAEADWCEFLRRTCPYVAVMPHRITLVFADGDRYTPDVVLIDDGALTLYEVKGGYRGPGWEQGIERFKRAQAEFPGLKLVMVTRKDGRWYMDGGLVREVKEG